MPPRQPPKPEQLSAEEFVAIQATMAPEVQLELNRLIRLHPPTSWDNFAAITAEVAGLVLQGKIHPVMANTAIRYFELSFTSLMVANDKHRPEKASNEKTNILAILSQGAVDAGERRKALPDYSFLDEATSVEILEPVEALR